MYDHDYVASWLAKTIENRLLSSSERRRQYLRIAAKAEAEADRYHRLLQENPLVEPIVLSARPGWRKNLVEQTEIARQFRAAAEQNF